MNEHIEVDHEMLVAYLMDPEAAKEILPEMAQHFAHVTGYLDLETGQILNVAAAPEAVGSTERRKNTAIRRVENAPGNYFRIPKLWGNSYTDSGEAVRQFAEAVRECCGVAITLK